MKVITIGRSTQNDVVINDPYVGRNHLQIIQKDDGCFYVADFGSKNGTYVNGNKVHGEVRLSSSDIVRIGNTTLPWKSYFPDITAYQETIDYVPVESKHRKSRKEKEDNIRKKIKTFFHKYLRKVTNTKLEKACSKYSL